MRLRLQNFRVFSDSTFDLPKQTVIQGANGSGKSSAVEALRLLSVGKSFRTSRLDEVISFDEPFFRLQLNFDKDQVIELFYGQAFAEQPGRDRVLTVNGKATALLDFVGSLPSVLFVPGDVEIVMGMPQIRRRYIDSILWQVSPEFRRSYLELGRILKERSTILFLLKVNRAGLDELQPWNELLVGATTAIRDFRGQYIKTASQTLTARPARPGLNYSVSYKIATETIDEVQPQEIKLAQNLYGAHRDEIEITLNDRSARRYASRGQARTAVACLKAIEAEFLARQLDRPPLVLLDDLLSELDEENAAVLFERLPKQSSVIATTIAAQKLFAAYTTIAL